MKPQIARFLASTLVASTMMVTAAPSSFAATARKSVVCTTGTGTRITIYGESPRFQQPLPGQTGPEFTATVDQRSSSLLVGPLNWQNSGDPRGTMTDTYMSLDGDPNFTSLTVFNQDAGTDPNTHFPQYQARFVNNAEDDNNARCIQFGQTRFPAKVATITNAGVSRQPDASQVLWIVGGNFNASDRVVITDASTGAPLNTVGSSGSPSYQIMNDGSIHYVLTSEVSSYFNGGLNITIFNADNVASNSVRVAPAPLPSGQIDWQGTIPPRNAPIVLTVQGNSVTAITPPGFVNDARQNFSGTPIPQGPMNFQAIRSGGNPGSVTIDQLPNAQNNWTGLIRVMQPGSDRHLINVRISWQATTRQ